MSNDTKNTRIRIPRGLYQRLAHLALDLPQSSVSSLVVEGAALVLEKYGRAVAQSAEQG